MTALAPSDAALQAIPEAGEDMVIANQRVCQRLLEHPSDAAIVECQPLLARLPDGEPGWAAPLMLYMAEAQSSIGDGEARATAERLIALLQPLANRVDEDDYPSILALAYAYAGRPEQALSHGRRAVEL